MENLCVSGVSNTTAILVERGADPRIPCFYFGPFGVLGRGNALFAAAMHGKTDVINTLIENGADVNQPGFTVGLGLYSWSPLSAAADGGHKAACEALVQAGADPELGIDCAGAEPNDAHKKAAAILGVEGRDLSL